MHLLPGIIADNTTLYLNEAKALVLSDLHIGYEEERRRVGVLLPQEQQRFFKAEMKRLLDRHEVTVVVLAGDIKHEFGSISQEEWHDVQEFVKGIQERGIRVEAVGGNHDILVKPILQKLNVELQQELVVENGDETILILHGDRPLEESARRLGKSSMQRISMILIGHEHPALRITDGLRTETTKCFLVGTYPYKQKKYQMIVMPSSNPLAFGTDVLRERPLGPLLDSFGDFSAFAVIDQKVLAFGFVESLQRL